MKVYVVVALAIIGAGLAYKNQTWPAIAFVALALVLAVIL